MNESEDARPHRPVEEVPQPPLSPAKAMFSLWLGLIGMVLFLFAMHIAATHRIGFSFKLNKIQPLAQTCPLLASIGCVMFIAAVVIAWRVRLTTLLWLASGSGVLVWLVVWVQSGSQ